MNVRSQKRIPCLQLATPGEKAVLSGFLFL
jgi:hypothetical protein